MKKIYTMLNQQDLGIHYYGNTQHELYDKMKVKVQFPVVAYLSSILEEDETFMVLVIDSFKTETSENNYHRLLDELNQYYPNRFSIKKIDAAFAHDQKGQISTFMQLYKTFEENDEVYFDVTFGLRPTPMTIFVSCNYAQKFIKNLKVCNMVYAHFDFQADENFVHPIVDITSLFLLNNLIETLSEANSQNPMRFLKSVFKFDEEC